MIRSTQEDLDDAKSNCGDFGRTKAIVLSSGVDWSVLRKKNSHAPEIQAITKKLSFCHSVEIERISSTVGLKIPGTSFAVSTDQRRQLPEREWGKR